MTKSHAAKKIARNKMKNKIALILISTSLIGCTSARVSRQLSAGVIGCPSSQIKITNETASMSGMHEFTAECDGRVYVCSYVYGSNTNCHERAAIAKSKTIIQNEKLVLTADECAARKRYNALLDCGSTTAAK
jgi:hypothetical protein